VIVSVLLVMLALIVTISTVEFAYVLIRDIVIPAVLLLGIDEILDIFDMFLIVLIGVGLMSSFLAYSHEKTVHVEVVLGVAMIAVARKVIVLDIKELDGLKLIAVALILTGLSVGYYFVKRTHTEKKPQ